MENELHDGMKVDAEPNSFSLGDVSAAFLGRKAPRRATAREVKYFLKNKMQTDKADSIKVFFSSILKAYGIESMATKANTQDKQKRKELSDKVKATIRDSKILKTTDGATLIESMSRLTIWGDFYIKIKKGIGDRIFEELDGLIKLKIPRLESGFEDVGIPFTFEEYPKYIDYRRYAVRYPVSEIALTERIMNSLIYGTKRKVLEINVNNIEGSWELEGMVTAYIKCQSVEDALSIPTVADLTGGSKDKFVRVWHRGSTRCTKCERIGHKDTECGYFGLLEAEIEAEKQRVLIQRNPPIHCGPTESPNLYAEPH